MDLTAEQQGWLDGSGGPALQWAMSFNKALGEFFDAPRMVPVASAHFAPDARLAGQPGLDLLARLADQGARARVPAYLDPCLVDLARAAEMAARGLPEETAAADRETRRHCRALGFLPTYSCVAYQTVSPPAPGTHLAWGDTGMAVMANAAFGARTNFEGGPSALASALLGATPAYGMHLDAGRAGNVVIRLDCAPAEVADWGAVAACAGAIATGYYTVPVLYGDIAPPSFAMLKTLGVALASYGGHALFHLVGVTPEAPSLEAACQGAVPTEEQVITRADLDARMAGDGLAGRAVDLVVFAAPQLAIDEVLEIARRLDGRRVHGDTRMILAVDPQVRAQVADAGLAAELEALGAEFATGTCFYPEAPLMRETAGWRVLVTNSAKLVNTLGLAGLDCALRRLETCLDAATTGRLAS